MEEIWRDVEGYYGAYKVSNSGRIKSMARKVPYKKSYRGYTGKILKPISNGIGYLYVQLSKDGKTENFYVHRLVGSAFIPNPDSHPQINHINENKHDNRSVNLEWCTQSYNNKQKFSKRIRQLTLDGELIKTWNSAADAERNGYSSVSISNCCHGKQKTHKESLWEFE